jgi:Nif-specific regulatory protein
MDPQLIAISGSLKGMIFVLSKDKMSVGREPSNTLCLNEPSVSRRHCLIKRALVEQPHERDARDPIKTDRAEPDILVPSEPDLSGQKPCQYQLIDLESFNGTFVNGLPIQEHTLAHGDQIALGDVQFLFLLHEEEVGTPAVAFDEADLITRSTVRLQPDAALYLRPEKVLAELPQTARIARELNTLLKISTTINSIRDRRNLQHRLFELILEVIPAERGAILLVDRSQDEFATVCGWDRKSGRDDSIRVSRTITNQVLREVVALLSNDIFENECIGETPSLVASSVCSLLCVPLVVFNKPLGVIYVDTTDPAARFDEGHLQLLTAIAGIAAIALENTSRFEDLQIENQRLQQEVNLNHTMIGESAPMQAVYSFIAKAAPTPSTVLILGESGTGKELAAYAIHLNSSRPTKPFVAINCATLTETLLESELFGHEKGAFTGAFAQKRGKLEIADGGSIFLDEVGELAPTLQAKLLRVLQNRDFERLGGTKPIKVDVRVIAATNRNLEEAIKSGGFRQDLYYRLNVVSLVMPALRDRREDIPLLASYFLSSYSKKCKRKVTGLSSDVRLILGRYDWPGNVRELENTIERAVVLGSSSLIMVEDLPERILESMAQPDDSGSTYYEGVQAAKRQLIIKALTKTEGNYTEAAKLLGVHPNNLHRLSRSLNLKADL